MRKPFRNIIKDVKVHLNIYMILNIENKKFIPIFGFGTNASCLCPSAALSATWSVRGTAGFGSGRLVDGIVETRPAKIFINNGNV